MGLREEFLELLKKDEEFRYTVLGYLGLEELTRRMDYYQSTQTKIWEEIKGLREEQSKIWEEIKGLREDFNKMLGRIELLEKGHVDLRQSIEGLRSELFVGFDSMRVFAGVSLEEFVKVWMSGYLRERGILPVGSSLDKAVVDGEEINLFSEEPLIVGEVTAYAGSVEEISKLLRKVEVAKKKYKKEPRYLFLRVLTAPSSVAKEMKRMARVKNIDLVIGKES
jgi:DNA repair exonuclease SbcCD ATPase subunit